MHIKHLVIGAGLSGSILARRIAEELEEEVYVIDKRNHIGGNIYDYKDNETNITIHKYGPHIFHTNNKKVWDYLSKFTKWEYFYNTPKAFVDGKQISLPFNLNSLYEVFSPLLANKLENALLANYKYNSKVSIMELKNNPNKDLNFLFNYIYEKIFLNYTLKQWGINPESLDENILKRVPILISRDNGYFQDKYQGVPVNGYTKMIEEILNHKLIKVELNTDYKKIKNMYRFSNIYVSSALDEFYDYKFGTLPYRSLEFDLQIKDLEYFQETAVVNYPNNYDFTRICEHKHFLREKSQKTIISIEYPRDFIVDSNERYYPINNIESQNIYNQYLNKANNEEKKRVVPIGRLGMFKYLNMDQAVEEILKIELL